MKTIREQIKELQSTGLTNAEIGLRVGKTRQAVRWYVVSNEPGNYLERYRAMRVQKNLERLKKTKVVTCIHCRKTKPKKEFPTHTRKTGSIQLYRTCKKCHSELVSARVKALRRNKDTPEYKRFKEVQNRGYYVWIAKIKKDPVRLAHLRARLLAKRIRARKRGYWVKYHLRKKAEREAMIHVKSQDPKIQEIINKLRGRV